MKTAIFDIDGTLFDMPGDIYAKWQGGEKFDWDKFLDIMDGQPVIHNAWQALSKHFLNNDAIVAVTARPEKYREKTEELLTKLGIPFDKVIMRPNVLLEDEGNEIEKVGHENPTLVKNIIHKHHARWRDIARDLLEEMVPQFEPVAAYDDQEKNLKVWMDQGAECYLVNKGKLKLLEEEEEEVEAA